MKKNCFVWILLIFLVSFPPHSNAEIFRLKSGKTVEGTVKFKFDTYYRIQKADGTHEIVYKEDLIEDSLAHSDSNNLQKPVQETDLGFCKDFLNRSSNYQNQVMTLLGQASALKIKWNSFEEKEAYEREKGQIFQEFQNLKPPKELELFHRKMQESFDSQAKLTEMINSGDQTKVIEYGRIARQTFQDAFKELKNVWDGRGCSEEFKRFFAQWPQMRELQNEPS